MHLTPEIVLEAYSMGLFPMAKSRLDPKIYWVDPEWRGILPFEHFHIPRSLRKTIRRQPYEIVCNRDFRSTIAACAETSGKRDDTWINPAIVEVFTDLHEMGYAHSVEAWRGDDLVGGLYGLALGGVFFGESMFARADDASKIALVDLVIRLQKSGFTILDTQFTNEHLLRFGAVEVPRGKYLDQMRTAIRLPVTFYAEPLGAVDVAGFLERLHGT